MDENKTYLFIMKFSLSLDKNIQLQPPNNIISKIMQSDRLKNFYNFYEKENSKKFESNFTEVFNNNIIEWKFNSPNITIKIKDIKAHNLIYSYNKFITNSRKVMLIIILSLISIIITICFVMNKINRRNDNRPLINISLENNNNDMNFGMNNEQVVNNLENASQNDSNRNNENIQAIQIPRSENEAHPRSNQDSPVELNT